MSKAPTSYQNADLEDILDFYNRPCTRGVLKKAELLEQITALADDLGLEAADRNLALFITGSTERRLLHQRRKHEAILGRIDVRLARRCQRRHKSITALYGPFHYNSSTYKAIETASLLFSS